MSKDSLIPNLLGIPSIQIGREPLLVCNSCGVGISFDTAKLAEATQILQEALEAVPNEITIKFFR